MKYSAQLFVLSLFLGVAFSSEEEKVEPKKNVDKRGALGLGNSLGHGFSGSGFGSASSYAPGVNPASFSGFTPALGAPAGWASIRAPFGEPSGLGAHGGPGFGYPGGPQGGPWNAYPDAAFGLGPVVLNKRTSLAAGLAHPDIGAATAAAHDRYAASSSNSAYSNAGPWANAGPWSSAGPWASAYPSAFSKYAGGCRC